ncbi:MAG: hypothetical protein AMK71_08985 [Nitrospira bacterium SG8_35_4]|nr:MAG: hypothetical protein AMK71_08985 [Nitrospira bacterium SG8_35_4]
MEKRSSERKMADLDAMIVSRSLNYKGVIRNLADDGICINIHSEQNLYQLLNGMLFEVRFALPSGENIDLHCEVIRTHRQTAEVLETTVGMKIIDQPPEYRQFLKTHH